MTDPEPLFPTREWPLAILSRPVAEIAGTLDSGVDEFVQEGLGPMRATWTRLDDGTPVAFIEHAEAPQLGTDVYVDATDFLAHGLEPLLARILERTGCARTDLTWLQADDVETRANAAQSVEYARAWRARKDAGK